MPLSPQQSEAAELTAERRAVEMYDRLVAHLSPEFVEGWLADQVFDVADSGWPVTDAYISTARQVLIDALIGKSLVKRTKGLIDEARRHVNRLPRCSDLDNLWCLKSDLAEAARLLEDLA